VVLRPGFVTPLKFSLISWTSWPRKIISAPFLELKKLLYYHRTFDEYLRFRRETATLRARIAGFEDVLKENTRLEKLLAFKRELIYSSIAANVIGRDVSSWNSTMILDKGIEAGVDVGMPVVSAMGVVGKVAEVTEEKSQVVLLTDPVFSVPALVQRSREVGLVSGTLQARSRMRYLSKNADIQIGDLIITSKLSSSFPEGLVIGSVVAVNSGADALATECLIDPAVNFSQIEEVLVIQKR